MIRGINIAINAAHPELPLVEATTFVGSPSSVFVRGVPKSCGNWRITAVSVAVTYPDNTTTTRVATESAQGVWVATIPGTATSGRTIGGFRILADGEDENGAAITGYVLGFADFAVFSMLPVPAPGETFYLFRYFDAQPATPKKGDAAIIGGVLKYYNGTVWTPFADLSNYYTKGETDEAVERVAAYYITSDAQGHAFATHAALVGASTYYSGGVARVPTRNDYAVVLADETHSGAEYRYIYAIADGATTGQWEAQYPIETNDYTGLSNKPSINSVALSGNKTGAQLGLANASDLTPLQLAALYPEGDVNSASEWATPWNGSTGIKYELDAATHTAAILTFSKTSNTANDNSHLTGRVVIPPFIESNGERYTVTSIKDHSTGGLPTYDLTEVVAPTTLATVGKMAFYFCLGLKRAYFPRASQLKQNAFQDCRALEYISIPNASNVPTQCFINDSSLKSLLIPNAESILLGGLSGCTALEFVDFGSVARSAVPTFYNQSFYNVPVTCKIIIPDSQYTAWTTASGWSGLVTQGYEFLRHSAWEYAREYELAAKLNTADVVAPSTSATAGKAADAKATGDALALITPDWSQASAYSAYDCVKKDGAYYYAKQDIAANTAWNANNWGSLANLAALAHQYLPLSGGTVTGDLTAGNLISQIRAVSIGGAVSGAKFILQGASDEHYIQFAYQNSKYGLFVKNGANDAGTFYALADFAPLASPALTGTPTAPTPTAGDNSTKLATTAFVQGAVPYALGTAQTISTASQDTSGAETIDYGPATMLDRMGNYVAITTALDELRVTFPPLVNGKMRDFLLRVEVGTGSAALAAPALVAVAPTGETITLENPDGEMPMIVDGTATAKGVTYLLFSESAVTGKFVVRGIELKEVA